MRWLVTNRNQEGVDGFGGALAPLTYCAFDPAACKNIALRSSWTSPTLDEFKSALIATASKFPDPITTCPRTRNTSRFSFTAMTTTGFRRSAATTPSPLNSLTALRRLGSLAASIGPPRAPCSPIFVTAPKLARPTTILPTFYLPSTPGCQPRRSPLRSVSIALAAPRPPSAPQRGQLCPRIRHERLMDSQEPPPVSEPDAGSDHGRGRRGQRHF